MDFIAFVLDFVLRIDKHLAEFVTLYGAWVYALLFAIIFVETGVVVMPFLPGDSLLFVVGALCGLGLMDASIAIPLMVAAAVGGDQMNYSIGRYFGPKVWGWEHSRFFNKRAFHQAHEFAAGLGETNDTRSNRLSAAARMIPRMEKFLSELVRLFIALHPGPGCHRHL